MRAEDNPNYITLLACTNPHRAVVAVMSYHLVEDSYTIKKCSDALSMRAAAALAESWAQALDLEIR